MAAQGTINFPNTGPAIAPEPDKKQEKEKNKSIMTTKTLGRLALITTPLAMIGGYYIAKEQKANVWIFSIAGGVLGFGIWYLIYSNAQDKEQKEKKEK